MLRVAYFVNLIFVLPEGCSRRHAVRKIFVELLDNVFLRVVSGHGIGAIRDNPRWPWRLISAGIIVFPLTSFTSAPAGMETVARLSGGDDMIAFDDEHGVLDCRPACPINQARPFQHDLPRFGLTAGAGASDKRCQENHQHCQNFRSTGRFHFLSPH